MLDFDIKVLDDGSVAIVDEAGREFVASLDEWQEEILPELKDHLDMLQRFEEACTQYNREHNNDLDFAWDTPFLLVENDRYNWLTLFETKEAAADYCFTSEGNWTPVVLIDLRDGSTYTPTVSTVFKRTEVVG